MKTENKTTAGYISKKGRFAQQQYLLLEKFRKNLTLLRVSMNLSCEGLDKELDLRQKRIWDLENGRCTPDIDELNKIATYFDVSLDTLMHKNAKLIFE